MTTISENIHENQPKLAERTIEYYPFIGFCNGCPFKNKDTAVKLNDERWLYHFKKKDGDSVTVGKTVANVADKYCQRLFIPVTKNGFILVGRRKGYYHDNCLAVIDFDVRTQADRQYVIDVLEDHNIYIDDTFAQQTGGGGIHIFYEVEGDIQPKSFPSEYIDKESGMVTDGLLNNPEHVKHLKGVDTRGNGGKIFIAGTKMVEHNGGEYKIISNKMPKFITEAEYFDILGLFVDKIVYDNVDGNKRRKAKNNLEFSDQKPKKHTSIKRTDYTAIIETAEPPENDPIWEGFYNMNEPQGIKYCMRPTRDFWRGKYVIQKCHNGAEHMYWAYFLVDLDLHGIHVEDSINHFTNNPKLQPEFEEKESLYQYQRPFIQEKIKPECFDMLDVNDPFSKILSNTVFSRYFPEYASKKKNIEILPQPNENIDHFEQSDEDKIIRYEQSDAIKQKIKHNNDKIKHDIMNFLNSDKKIFIIGTQVGTGKTKGIKDAVYEYIGANADTKTISVSPNIIEYYTTSNKARPINYIRTDFPPPNDVFYRNIIGKVESVNKELRFHCRLAEHYNKCFGCDQPIYDFESEECPSCGRPREVWYDPFVAQHCQYFFGCLIDRTVYHVINDKYDPDRMFYKEKRGEQDLMMCVYHDTCEWIAQKKEIISNYKSDVPDCNFFISNIFQYKFIREITDELRSPNLIIFDENFINWQLQWVRIGKINEWYNRPNSLFHGTNEHIEYFKLSSNSYEYCLCINDITIREDIWDCHPSTIHNFGYMLYQVGELKKSTNKIFAILEPSIELRKMDEWKRHCERSDTAEIKRLLKQYGILTIYGKTLMNIPLDTKVIFASATTSLPIIKEMFKEDLYITENEDMTKEELEQEVTNKIEVYQPEDKIFETNYFPNPIIEIDTRRVIQNGKASNIQWSKNQTKSQIEKIIEFIDWYNFTRPLIIVKKNIEDIYEKEIKRICPKAKVIHYGDAVGRNDCFYDEIEDDEGNVKKEYIDGIMVIGRFAYDDKSVYMYKQIGIEHIEDLAKGDVIQAIGRGRPLELSNIPIILFTDRDILTSDNKQCFKWSVIEKIIKRTKEKFLKCKTDKDFMLLFNSKNKAIGKEMRLFQRIINTIEKHINKKDVPIIK